MTRDRSFLSLVGSILVSLSVIGPCLPSNIPNKPNLVILLADDLGWGDLKTFGNPVQEENAIDQMAADGLVLLDAYSADSLCTPSRAALLTGRYAARYGLYSSKSSILRTITSYMPTGLPHSEVTIAEALRESGYATGMVGKWNLGINQNSSDDGYYLPEQQGFDYVGYNFPMGGIWLCDDRFVHLEDGPDPVFCFAFDNSTVIQQPIKFENVTQNLLNDAKSFITANQHQPFFFYFSFMHVHTPLFANPEFAGASKRGHFGDNIAELGWAVGEVLDHLRLLGIAENTLVLFTSDNGPHKEICEEGGSTGPFKGGKSNFWEGGVRMPTVFWMPGTIAPGVSREIFSHLDILPTFVELAGSTLPSDTVYDGVSQVPMLFEGTHSTRSHILFYCAANLFTVRYDQYKFVFRTHRLVALSELLENCPEGKPIDEFYADSSCDGKIMTPPLIFDLDQDPGETFPLDGMEDTLAIVIELANEHNRTFAVGLPGFDMLDCDVVPCCDPPHCTCNYNGPPLFTDDTVCPKDG